MNVVSSCTDTAVVDALKGGQSVVLKTDTIYGILARADDEQAVEYVYQLKQRQPSKSPIVLVANQHQLYDTPSQSIQDLTSRVWPGPVSLIMPSVRAPHWIRRDNDSVAYRLPDLAELRQLIEATGPLIAPSANPEGLLPAVDIEQAMAYFGDGVAVYVDGGTVQDAAPSKLLQIEASGEVRQLR